MTDIDTHGEWIEELTVRSKTHPIECSADECSLCGVRDCPSRQPDHYHHDGCPACFFREQPKIELSEITVHRRSGVPMNEAWHEDVTKIVHKEFNGKPTLWNSAWIEYHVLRSLAKTIASKLRDLGHAVEITDI